MQEKKHQVQKPQQQQQQQLPDQKSLHASLDSFYARGYLSTWCCQPVRLEWAEFLHRVFTSSARSILGSDITSADRPWVADVGCGPSISNVISASAFTDNILMCDFLRSNREEVEKWRRGSEDAFVWSHYFDLAGILELNADPGAIERRTRDAIRGVRFCDIVAEEEGSTFDFEDEESSPEGGLFDVVIASLVFDVVAVDDQGFARALANVGRHLKPGGLLVVQGSLGEKTYSVGSASFPVMCADEEGLRRIFEEGGFRVVKWELCVKLSTQYFTLLQKIK